jgi:HSP20 family protein
MKRPLELRFLDVLQHHHSGKQPRRNSSTQRPTYSTSSVKEAVFIEVELPGVTKDALKVDLIDDVLVVTGSRPRCMAPSREPVQDKQQSDEKEDRVEMADRFSYEARFKLQQRQGVDGIEAEYRNGLLTIRVPQVEKTMPRRVAISP